MERLLRINEVCERTSLSRTTIYELVNRGQLPTVHIGKALRIPERALDQWIAEQYRVGEPAA